MLGNVDSLRIRGGSVLVAERIGIQVVDGGWDRCEARKGNSLRAKSFLPLLGIAGATFERRDATYSHALTSRCPGGKQDASDAFSVAYPSLMPERDAKLPLRRLESGTPS